MGKYVGQQCQDDEINKEFGELHKSLVNQIIQFCKKHDISIDEIHLNADHVAPSIPYGEWQSCTDSYFVLEKFTEEYKDAVSMRKIVSKEEFRKIRLEQQPYIYSM